MNRRRKEETRPKKNNQKGIKIKRIVRPSEEERYRREDEEAEGETGGVASGCIGIYAKL